MKTGREKNANRYSKIIEEIFFDHYRKGDTQIDFRREEIESAARKLGIVLPKNLGDLIYTFRYRGNLPDSITAKAPKGTQWVIRPRGRSVYRFEVTSISTVRPTKLMAETKVPDATPGVISMYALSDEQALLAKVRYNRLVDIFTSVTCYSLQNHLRTAVPGIEQVETDEIYVGIDKRGAHYIFPVQAKGQKDKLNIVQIEQDIEVCRSKFPSLICRPIGALFLEDDLIALFEFVNSESEVSIVTEKHYRLVPPDEISDQDLITYSQTQN
jgi:hypothetical protein